MAQVAEEWIPGRREMVLCKRAILQVRRRCRDRVANCEDLGRLNDVARIAGIFLATGSNNARYVWVSIINEAVEIADNWPRSH